MKPEEGKPMKERILKILLDDWNAGDIDADVLLDQAFESGAGRLSEGLLEELGMSTQPLPAPEETTPIKLNEFQLASIAIWAQDSGPDIGDVWGNEEVRRLNLTAFARKILGDQKASSPSVEPALICRNCGQTKQWADRYCR